MGEASAIGEFAGALGHVVNVIRIFGDDGMNAPDKCETARCLALGCECENGRRRALTRAGSTPGGRIIGRAKALWP